MTSEGSAPPIVLIHGLWLTPRSWAGGRRSTPFTCAGEMATPAAPSPRSSRSSVTSPPKECPMITGGPSSSRIILS